ncbi:KIFC3 [Symbiodinium sp. CCMP2456]|nr:KIFC3 [Symbiodinium sp. CCMP2456]
MACLVAASTMLKLIVGIVLKPALAGLMSDLPLPRCEDFTDLKLYVYDLPESFNVDLYEELEKRATSSGSNCDFVLSPCDEDRWAFKYSVARQRGEEIIILRKLFAGLSCPQVKAASPEDADVFVVPYLAGLDCFLGGHMLRCPTRANQQASDLFSLLAHYSPATRHRHLFIATADIHSLPLQLQAQPLLISHGTTWGAPSGYLVSPSAVTNVVAQSDLPSRASSAPVLFWLAASPTNVYRRALFAFLEQFNASLSDSEHGGQLHRAGRVVMHRLERLQDHPAPRQFSEELQQAAFCPVPPGETSGGIKRLLDALLSGCLPVVIVFPTSLGSGRSWWRAEGPPVEWSLPFPWEIDWQRLVVEVSEADFWQGRLVPSCLNLSSQEELEKRKYIAEVRDFLRYDLAGGSRDAFSLLMDGVRLALASLNGHGAQVCYNTPRLASPRRVFLDDGDSILEKGWSHAFSEISCFVPSSWKPAAAFYNATTQDPVVFEQYAVTHYARGFGDILAAGSVYDYARTDATVTDLAEQKHTLSTSMFALCFADPPEACHGGDKPEPCATSTAPPSSTRCRLLADVMPFPNHLATRKVQMELVTTACREREHERGALADPDQGSGISIQFKELVVHEAVYKSCDEEFDAGPGGSGSGGKSSTWLLLEHALARLYQVRDGMRVPDLLLLVVPSDSARLRSLLEQFVERFASRSLREAATSDWLYVVESPPSGLSWSCDGHQFMSIGCHTEVFPEALIFPTELLRRARAPNFEAATSLRMTSDPRDPLMLVMAILMDMGGVDLIHEGLPYEPGSKDDPGLSDAVRAYESFQGIDHFSWDHLESRVACLHHRGFFYLFDWKHAETLADQTEESRHLLISALGRLTDKEWDQVAVLGVCIPGDLSFTFQDKLEIGWHQLLKHIVNLPPNFWEMPIPKLATIIEL